MVQIVFRHTAKTLVRLHVSKSSPVAHAVLLEMLWTSSISNTLQPLYNTVRYNTIFDITRFKDGSQKCIDYIAINGHYFNIIYTFSFGYNTVF